MKQRENLKQGKDIKPYEANKRFVLNINKMSFTKN